MKPFHPASLQVIFWDYEDLLDASSGQRVDSLLAGAERQKLEPLKVIKGGGPVIR